MKGGNQNIDDLLEELQQHFIEMGQLKSDFDIEKFTVRKEGNFLAHNFHFLMRQYSLTLTELRRMLLDREEQRRYIEKYKKFYATDQLRDSEPITEFKCVQPFQRVVISNQTIAPCCVNFNKELTIGKLGKDTIHQAWHSKKMNELRNLHKRGEFYLNKTCKDCVNLIYPNIKF